MKRTVIILSLIFALAIALSVSIPTLAAGIDTGTTTITGTVGGSIEITTAPGDFSLSDMVVGTPKESGDLTVVVKCNKAGWTLTVAETSGNANDGKMEKNADPYTPLTNPLQVKGGDLLETYVPLTSA